MYKYELRPSKLLNYPYLCVTSVHDMLDVSKYCCENFGPEGNKTHGVWYEGMLGVYFKHRLHAVQFIMSWG